MKNDGHVRISHTQISFKQFSNICENVVHFLPHTVCNFKFWKIDPPFCIYYTGRNWEESLFWNARDTKSYEKNLDSLVKFKIAPKFNWTWFFCLFMALKRGKRVKCANSSFFHSKLSWNCKTRLASKKASFTSFFNLRDFEKHWILLLFSYKFSSN